MKVKQIIGEDGAGGPSNQGPQGFGDKTQKYDVVANKNPNMDPNAPKTFTVVPHGVTPSTNGQPVPGQMTLPQDAIDFTDPNNPKIDPTKMGGQSSPLDRNPNDLDGKTLALGEEPNEDQLSTPQAGQRTAGEPLAQPDVKNTITPVMKGGRLLASDGNVIEPASREIDQQYVQDPVNATNQLGYIKVNGKMYMTLNTGHKWKVSPSVFKMISSSQPLQQEEQGGPSGLSRIAHLAGIR